MACLSPGQTCWGTLFVTWSNLLPAHWSNPWQCCFLVNSYMYKYGANIITVVFVELSLIKFPLYFLPSSLFLSSPSSLVPSPPSPSLPSSLSHPSLKTKIWFQLLKLITGPFKPLLYSYQRSLPRLPVPKLEDTCRRVREREREREREI